MNDEVSVPKGKARLNFIAFTGQAPIKVEDVTRISITDGLNCKIAVPIMVSMGSNVKSISVDVYDASGKLQTTVESAANNYSVEIPEVIPEEIVPVEIPEEVYTPTEAPKKTSNANRVISRVRSARAQIVRETEQLQTLLLARRR